MFKKLSLVFLLVISLLFSASPVIGQDTCDLCGYCGGSEYPQDYTDCLSCIYENPGPPPRGIKAGVTYTVIGCLPTNPANFIQKVVTFTTTVAGGITFLLLIYGSFKVLNSRGDPVQLAHGKGLLVSAMIALFLIIFSVFILRFVGVNIFQLPGFG